VSNYISLKIISSKKILSLFPPPNCSKSYDSPHPARRGKINYIDPLLRNKQKERAENAFSFFFLEKYTNYMKLEETRKMKRQDSDII